MKNKIIQPLRRVLGLVLAAGILMSGTSMYAAWDGYEEKIDNVHLVDMDLRGSVNSTNGSVSSAVTHGHTYSLYWNHASNVHDIAIPVKNTPRDWTQYTMLNLWIYSPKAVTTKSNFMLIVYCDPEEVGALSYLSYTFDVDWEGWKQFKLPISELAITRNANPQKVTDVHFVNTGWSMTPNPECEVYIGEIVLEADAELPGNATSLYGEKDRETLLEAFGDGYALYAESPNAYRNGGQVPLDAVSGAAAVEINGVTAAPQSFFETYLGARVTAADGEHTLTVNGNVYTGGFEQDGTVYFPAAETASALGYNTAEEDGLVLIGTDGAFSVIMGNRIFKEALSYMAAYRKPDTKKLTSDDYKVIKDRWRADLVGDETVDLSDATVAARVKQVSAAGNSAWMSMNKGNDIEELWGKKITTTAEMTARYGNIAAMAKAWATYGSSLYHNESLRDDILYALQWMYENRYGEAEKTNSGWRNTGLFNWWDWQIGTPTYLIDTLMLMESELDLPTIKNYLSLFDKLLVHSWDYGSNKVNFCREIIGSGLLQENPARILTGRDEIDPTMQYSDGGEVGTGFYTDGSYVYHNLHPMNGTYGIEHFVEFAPLVDLLDGTPFEFCNPLKDNIYDWAFSAFEPVMYRGDIFRFVMGRDPENAKNTARRIITTYLSMLDSAPEDVAARLKSIIKYTVQEDTTINYYTDLSLLNLARLKAIMEDDSIQPRENYILNKVYYNMDKAVHQHEDYAFGVSMSSSRIYNYESINHANMTGWYLSDGMTYLYTENEPTQFDSGYWVGVDPYRLPGTTVNTGEREAASIWLGNEYLSSQDFVGGVSLGGQYGTAAMYLESYHSDGIGMDRVDDGYGGGNPARDCTLEAQKAWFMFDDEIVALGSNIHAQDGLPVLTVVENRKSKDTEVLAGEVSAYEVVGVVASEVPQEENIPENTIDGDLGTRWSGENDATITWDLGTPQAVGYAALAFWQDDKRKTYFDLEVSEDGEEWEQVYSGKSNGKSEQPSAYTLQNQTARFVRLCGHGNTSNNWTSVLSAEIYPANEDGSITMPEIIARGKEIVTVDGEIVDVANEDISLDGVSWVQLEGTGGYYFPESQTVKTRKTSATNSFFELWLDHGTDPQDETYSYVLLPNKSVEETAAYAQDADVEILINTPEIQAVREKRLGVTGYVFWQAGTYDGITVSEPMIVMVKENNGEVEVSVSDPTQKLTSGTVTFDRALSETSADQGVTVVQGANTSVKVNFKDSYGKSFETKLTVAGGSSLGDNNKPNEGDDNSENNNSSSGNSGSGSGGSSSSGSGGGKNSSSSAVSLGGAVRSGTSEIAQTVPSAPFTDLAEAAWAETEIKQLYASGVVSPAEDGRFRPNDAVTREEYVKLLMEAFGLKAEGKANPFADEAEGAWYTPYLAAARQIGLVNGYEDGRFGVGEQITRQDMATMAYRAIGLVGKTLTATAKETAFSDVDAISDYAREAVTVLQRAGIISGMTDGSFAPEETASRAQAAKIIAGLQAKAV